MTCKIIPSNPTSSSIPGWFPLSNTSKPSFNNQVNPLETFKMSLSGLPSEILLRIFQYIPRLPTSEDTTSTQSLANISICSHQLHMVVDSVLYSSFTETSTTSLMSFLRTILQIPRLASYVKTYQAHDTRTVWLEATLEYPVASDSKSQEDNDKVLEELLEKSMERSPTLGMTMKDLWKEDSKGFINGDWDAATALALVLFPNLKVFKVTYSQSRLRQIDDGLSILLHDSFRLPWLNKALQRNQPPQPAIIHSDGKPTMETIMNLARFVTYSKEELNPSNTTFTLYIQNNSFTKLKVKDLSSCVWDFDILDNPILSQITDFEFINSIHPMIPCKQLYSRFLRLERICIVFPNASPFRFTSLVPAIRHLSTCLKDLTVKGWCTSTISRASSEESLVAFTALERLDITLQHLLLFYPADHPPIGGEMWNENYLPMGPDFVRAPLGDVLPGGVKWLTLRRCDQHTIEHVGCLVQERLRGSRKLESLHLDYLLAEVLDDVEDDMKLLRLDCEEAGIKLTTTSMYLLRSDVPRYSRRVVELPWELY